MLRALSPRLSPFPIRTFSKAFFSTEQHSNKFAVIFPGQGIQKVGMCQEFLDEAWSQDFLSKCDQKLGFSVQNTSLKLSYIGEGPQETLNLTEYAQPAIFIQSYLKYKRAKLTRKIAMEDIQYLFGHSLGEYNALVAAESLDPLEVVRTLQTRGRLMQQCCEGKQGIIYKFKEMGMAVVLADYEKIGARVREIAEQNSQLVCDIAAINSPKQFVLSGEVEVIDQVRKELKKNKIASVRMNVSAAFHSSLLIKMKEEFREVLQQLSISRPRKDVIRNYDTKIYRDKEDIIHGLTEQINNPVLFQKTIEYCFVNNVRRFIDVGEEGTLSIMLRQLSKDVETVKIDASIL